MNAARQRGGDPCIGRKLAGMLERAGFRDVRSTLIQPFARVGDIKEMAMLDFANITDTVMKLGLLQRAEAETLAAEVNTYAGRPDTTISPPRIFQAWARKT